MTRKSFVNEASIQNTTIALGGFAADGAADGVVFGQYASGARDIEFTNGVSLAGRVQQVKLINDGVFLVGSDDRGTAGAATTLPGVQSIAGLVGLTTSGANPATALANTNNSVPEGSIFKMEYAPIGPGGKMYFIGAPRTKIFQADFNPTSYKTSKGITFNFGEPAYSVSGSTDPYYVGSKSEYAYDDANSTIILTSQGIVQNGITIDDSQKNPVNVASLIGPTGPSSQRFGLFGDLPTVPTQGAPPAPLPPASHLNSPYYSGAPIDPWPQQLAFTSDLSSRGFIDAVMAQTSLGYIFAGAQPQAVFPGQVGLAVSVRYLIDDPGPTAVVPYRPITQAHTDINLNVVANSGDIRIARFDVESSGIADTIYVFGANGVVDQPNNNGPVLSFISEGHVYGNTDGLPFQLSFGNPMEKTLRITTLDLHSSFLALASFLQEASGGTVELDEFYYNQYGKFQIITTGILLMQIQCIKNQTVDHSEFASYFGFKLNTPYDLSVINGSGSLKPELDGPNPQVTAAVAAYNGLSWDDGGPLSGARPSVSAMPIGGPSGAFNGPGLQAWSFDPESQTLAFAIGVSVDTPVGATRQSSEFNANGRFKVPDNCIDIEVHMWGAGGSADPNEPGTGGAGAYLFGHLKHSTQALNGWTPGEVLDIVVGASTHGASRAGVGAGGGRSAIVRRGIDIVTAGGGGGSVGRGIGGAAAATGTAESGKPVANGGQGASSNGPGLGGAVYGDPRIKRASSGSLHNGGASLSSAKASGGGAGGGGYYGGGAGGFLGYTNDANDIATGGGGGSSFTENLMSLRAVSGVGANTFTNDQYWEVGIGEGARSANSLYGTGVGGHGRVVLVVTTTATLNARILGDASSTGSTNIWVTKPGSIGLMSSANWGSSGTSDWSDKFLNVQIPNAPTNIEVYSMYVGPTGLLIVITNDVMFDTMGSNVWWTVLTPTTAIVRLQSAGTDVFGPIDWVSLDGTKSATINSLKNIRSIRPLEPGSNDVVFIGDGIRIATAPGSTNGSWSRVRFVLDEFGIPLDDTMALVDAQLNSSTLEIVGQPNSLNFQVLASSPWCPQFASFYDISDVPNESVPYTPWPTATPGIAAPALAAFPGSGPLRDWQTGSVNAVPNLILLINVTLNQPSQWYAINMYDSSTTTDMTDPGTMANGLQKALQSFLNYIVTVYPQMAIQGTRGPQCAVIVGPSNILYITFTSIGGQRPIFNMAFSTSGTLDPTSAEYAKLFLGSKDDVDYALAAAGTMLGFEAIAESTTESVGTPQVPEYEASWQGTSAIGLQPNTSKAPGNILTPLSVAIDINSAFAGSLYHTYSPTPKFASSSTVLVAVGGPLASPVDSLASTKSLKQLVPSPGSSTYVDFVNDQDASQATGWGWRWAFFNPKNTSATLIASPIRSPANILVSIDNGQSYGYTESLLGAYLRNPKFKEDMQSTIALTALDIYHTNGGSVGPAKFRDFSVNVNGSVGNLNAVVSQFNDVKWYESPNDATKGFFLAVGQFLWEFNAIASQTCKWPTSLGSLRGVVWVSTDGTLWTTLPMEIESLGYTQSTEKELFWMVYKTDYIDKVNNRATLSTDLGLFLFDVQKLYNTVVGLFTVAPVTDFENGPYMGLTPIARNGIYAAACTNRDPTGTCINCLDGAMPVTIPQIVGPEGLQPNLDVCIKRPESSSIARQDNTAYSSIESAVDQYAIAAYAGYDEVSSGMPASKYVTALRQSFYSQTASADSIFICPQHVDALSTPSTVTGTGFIIGAQLQCALDPAMAAPQTIGTINVSGGFVVRRPAIIQGGLLEPAYTYDGTAYQPMYAKEYRHLTLVAFDAVAKLLPDTCPSTLGLGGSQSVFDNSNLGTSEFLARTGSIGTDVYGSVSSAIVGRVTNLAAQSGLAGPFSENESLGTQGGNWNPTNDPKDRAVLANDDTLDMFGYARKNDLTYDPFNVSGPTSKNPYLYRLASFEFPYDGQTRLDAMTQITIGRDPQVFEPGFGPLVQYLGSDPSSVGFAVSKQNSALTPWPANPLPQEGFGHWWIRTGASGAIVQAALGYGTLVLSQLLNGTDLFVYDPTSASATTKFLESNWTPYVPFSGGPNVGPLNAARFEASKASIQNLLTLRLKNNSEIIMPQLVNNWKYLVSVNFFRPRNWAFAGLLLTPDGMPVANINANGVPQQVLSSDQPNTQSQYEFLVPDPYFAAAPVGATIVGYQNVMFTPSTGTQGPDYKRVTTALVGPDGVMPPSLTVLDTTTAIFSNIIDQHVAMHYWTYNRKSQVATLDLFLNISRLYTGVDSASDFDWLTSVSLPQSAFDPSQLKNILYQFTPSASNLQNASDAILAYAENPLKAFVWTDPTAQTTRSLQSLAQESIAITQTVFELLYVVQLTDSGAALRTRGSKPLLQDYEGLAASMIHHRFTIVLGPAGSAAGFGLMASGNANAVCLFGTDDYAPGAIGAVPLQDPRGLRPESNFTPAPQVINVSTSDYDVETNNAPYFVDGQGGQYRQDLCAQDGQKAKSATIYGDPVYGFGLRIDADALRVRQRKPTSVGDPDVPADHGYVSMVRTIVDGHGRFTRPATLDAWPHVARLTYVTKYVPSKLRAYGAMVPLAPMRFLGAVPQRQASTTTPVARGSQMGTPQNIINPFRPRGAVLVEGVPLVPWSRSTLGSDPGTWAVKWNAFQSTALDLEGPGYYGRQGLAIADCGPNMFAAGLPAGYEGLTNGSTIILNEPAVVQTLRTASSTVVNEATGTPGAEYKAFMESHDAVAGLMLFNIADLESSSGEVRLEVAWQQSATSSSTLPLAQTIRIRTTLSEFYSGSSGLLVQYNSRNPVANVNKLVTAAELSEMFQNTLQAWISTTIAPLGVTLEFDPVSDRPTFTFAFSDTTLNISTLRLFVPSPLSNWLGMRPISATPMYNFINDDLRVHCNIRYNLADTHPEDMYLDTSTLPSLYVYRNQLTTSDQAVGTWDATISGWLGTTQWVSPGEFSHGLYYMELDGRNAIGDQSNHWVFGSTPYPGSPSDGDAPVTGFQFSAQGPNNALGNFMAWNQPNLPDFDIYQVIYSTGLSNWTGSQVSPGAGSFDYMYSNHGGNGDGNNGPRYFAYSAPTASTWDTGTNAWTSGGVTDSAWQAGGWSSATVAPMYSLYYDGPKVFQQDNGSSPVVASVTFSGRSYDATSYKLCDILNVSWTARLSARLSTHWWGLGFAPKFVALNFSAYQAAAELTTWPEDHMVQAAPSQYLFMSGDASIVTTAPFQNSTPSLFVDAIGLPAVEVPSALGSFATSGKPANYDSIFVPIGSTAPVVGGPPIDVVAAGSAQISNYSFKTRLTYNAMTPVNLTASGTADGTLASPFQFQSQTPFANLVPAAATSTGGPPETLPPAGTAGLKTITNASASALFAITQECYVNLGSMTATLNRTTGTQYALYVFNWTELFATLPGDNPYRQSWSGPAGIKANSVDLSKLLKTYIVGSPFFMDEAYDLGAYSKLGRSLFIGASVASSGGAPLRPTAEEPVIVIMAPAAPGPLNNSVPLANTFSNGLLYSFTETYDTPQVYSLGFTSPTAGPMYTFYGLDNAVSVVGAARGLPRSSNGIAMNNQLVARKAYYDFSGALNDTLGLDVRQVYPDTSTCVGPQAPIQVLPGAAAITRNTYKNSYNFRVATFEQPVWAKATVIVTPFLPLAGTWNGDVGPDTAPEAAVQMVANYEGLAVLAEWAPSIVATGSALSFVPKTDLPQFTLFAVDRNPKGPMFTKPGGPFEASSVNTYRPSTVFTIMCDVWRNTLRAPQKPTTPGFAAPINGVSIDLVDCMGPEDYDLNDVASSTYFGNCQSTTVMAANAAGWAQTPWKTQNYGNKAIQVWSPFTGGSYWNSFQADSANAPPSTAINFAPNLWWPTYRWDLSKTDPNNVWPTSVATNPTLLKSNYALFTCTDGSIRKVVLEDIPNNAYPVIDSTNFESFYNSGINGDGDGTSVYSYTWPGRLYNLTWFADQWWCTADNSAVWTTAPLDDTARTLINDPIVVEQFINSVIKFRPMALSEGHPGPWINSAWPAGAPHKYNCMRIITYQGRDALFVSSVDGEFVIITREGSKFVSVLPDANIMPWLFLPLNQKALLYVTDLTVVGDSLVVGSMPVPLDPSNSPVPWADGSTLPVDSLSFTPANQISASNFMGGHHNIWPRNLITSNVLNSTIKVQYNNNNSIESIMGGIATSMSTEAIGSSGTQTIITLDSNNNIQAITIGAPATGLSRIVRPKFLSFFDMVPYYLSSLGGTSISQTNIKTGHSISRLPGQRPLGSVQLGLQFTNSILAGEVVRAQNGTQVVMPTFYKAGIDVDATTKAFFMINTPTVAQTGLKLLTNAKPSDAVGFDFSDLEVNGGPGGWSNAIVQTETNSSPLWANSVVFSAALGSDDNGAIGSVVLRPPQGLGPMSKFVANGASFSPKDYTDLNIFQIPLITRMAPIIANLVISDMAYGKEVSAMVWTTYGPYGAEHIRMSNVGPTFTDAVARTGDPQVKMVGPSKVAWNPYEMKFYAYGLGNNIEDFVKPSGISDSDWSNSSLVPVNNRHYKESQTRLMFLSADASTGVTYTDAASAYAVPFTPVYEVTRAVAVPKTNPQQFSYSVSPVAARFSTVDCMGFSQNIVAVGGGAPSADPKSPQLVPTIMWRTNIAVAGNDVKANWTHLTLGVPGTVSAIKFVGYAWYIAIWDAYANFDAESQQFLGQSSLYFSSINFNGISFLDAWNAKNNVALKITTIDASVLTSATCDPGFEPDPANPNMCLKVCPTGYRPFGSLCVQTCPPPFTETGLANECVPDALPARLVSPTADGAAPTTPGLKVGPPVGLPKTSIQWNSLISITILVVLAMIVLVGLVVKGFLKH